MSSFSISPKDANNKLRWTNDFAFRRGRIIDARNSPKRRLNCIQQFFADIRNPKCICGALRPLLLLSFLVGISPFKAVGSPGNRHLEMTFIGVINTLFHMVLFCTSYVLRVINQQSLVAHFFHSKVTRFGEDLQILTSFTALAFTLILCFLKRDKLRQLIHVLIKIDKNLSHLGAKLDYKHLSRVVLLALFIQWLCYSIFIVATFILVRSLKDQPDFFEWMFFFLPIAVVSTLKVQFYCMTQLIKYRLRYLNLLLNNLHAEQMKQYPNENMDKMQIYKFCGIVCDVAKIRGCAEIKMGKYDIIAELCRAHEELCDACYLAEEYFSHQMLTTVAIEFVCTLFNCFFMFEVIYNNTTVAEVNSIEFICYFSFYTLMSMGTLYALLRSSESVTAENEKCAIFVHKLLNVMGRHEIDTKDLLTRFSMQLLHRKIKFTACGLFSLDNTLIFTMVGAATTYLIILFQMGNAIK